jgi:hypothetical protein
MRQITLMKTTCSKRLIGGGARCTVTNSGELLQKGTAKSGQLGPPLDALILSDDKHGLALFLDHCLELRVVAVNGTMMNSGELLWYTVSYRGD